MNIIGNMVKWHFALFTLMVFWATSSAASSDIEVPVVQDVIKALELPEECKGLDICHIKPQGYDDLEPKIIAALPRHLKKRNAELTSANDTDEFTEILSPRSDWHNCPYITKKVPVYMYLLDDSNDVVVQTPSFRQTITTVHCAHEYISAEKRGKEECFQDLGLSLLGLTSTCVTIYAKQTQYVYDMTTQKVVQKSISIPASCSCVLRHKSSATDTSTSIA